MSTPAQRKWYLEHQEVAKLATKKVQEKNAKFWKENNPYSDTTLKICYECRKPKTRFEFNKFCRATDGLWSLCKECDRLRRSKVGPTIPKMISEAKKRAKRKSLEFNLTKEDIFIPEFCPVLGLKLEFHRGRRLDSSPSLDRIKPSMGYVKGNVRVISQRANLLKSNATIEELEKVLLDARQLSAAEESKHAA